MTMTVPNFAIFVGILFVITLWVLVSTVYLAYQIDRLRAAVKTLQVKDAQMDAHHP